jgi:hypothetical protein
MRLVLLYAGGLPEMDGPPHAQVARLAADVSGKAGDATGSPAVEPPSSPHGSTGATKSSGAARAAGEDLNARFDAVAEVAAEQAATLETRRQVEAHRKELAHKHEAELKAAKLEAVRELALRTLKEAHGVVIGGHGDERDGLYKLTASEHSGFPCFVSATGHHLYRSDRQKAWILSGSFTPDGNVARSWVCTDSGEIASGLWCTALVNSEWQTLHITVCILTSAKLVENTETAVTAHAEADRRIKSLEEDAELQATKLKQIEAKRQQDEARSDRRITSAEKKAAAHLAQYQTVAAELKTLQAKTAKLEREAAELKELSQQAVAQKQKETEQKTKQAAANMQKARQAAVERQASQARKTANMQKTKRKSVKAMLVSGLTGRAAIANGTYRVVPGELQHRRPVYRQADATSARGTSRLIYDKTPGVTPAWMVELPDAPGKAYATCEDRARTPDAAETVWHVWECEVTTPIEHGKWFPRSAFRVVAEEAQQKAKQKVAKVAEEAEFLRIRRAKAARQKVEETRAATTQKQEGAAWSRGASSLSSRSTAAVGGGIGCRSTSTEEPKEKGLKWNPYQHAHAGEGKRADWTAKGDRGALNQSYHAQKKAVSTSVARSGKNREVDQEAGKKATKQAWLFDSPSIPSATSSAATVARCKDGSRDMRFSANRGCSKYDDSSNDDDNDGGGGGGGGTTTSSSSGNRTCNDGSRDMRCSENKGHSKYGTDSDDDDNENGTSVSYSYSGGYGGGYSSSDDDDRHRCNDGSLDMRYSENFGCDKYDD